MYWLVQATVHLPLLVAGYAVYVNIAYWPMGLPSNPVSLCPQHAVCVVVAANMFIWIDIVTDDEAERRAGLTTVHL